MSAGSVRGSTADRLATGAGLVALGAMLMTPATAGGGRARRVLTTVTVTAGFVRTAAIDVRTHRAARGGALAVGSVAVTALLERAGVRSGRLFGRYHYTDALWPRAGGVPAVVPLAWAAMTPPAHATAAAALGGRSTPAARIIVGSTALTAWDLFLDPQMTREGVWRWMQHGTYRGVPLRNFAGWIGTSAILMALRELVVRSSEESPAAHVTTYATVGGMETVAFATFLRDRLVAVVGGVPMLSLAAVAVRRHR